MCTVSGSVSGRVNVNVKAGTYGVFARSFWRLIDFWETQGAENSTPFFDPGLMPYFYIATLILFGGVPNNSWIFLQAVVTHTHTHKHIHARLIDKNDAQMPSASRMIDSWLHRPLRFECRSLLRQHVWCQSDGTLQARSSNQYEIAWKGEWVNDRGALSSWAPGWCDYWEYYFAMCFPFLGPCTCSTLEPVHCCFQAKS